MNWSRLPDWKIQTLTPNPDSISSRFDPSDDDEP